MPSLFTTFQWYVECYGKSQEWSHNDVSMMVFGHSIQTFHKKMETSSEPPTVSDFFVYQKKAKYIEQDRW